MCALATLTDGSFCQVTDDRSVVHPTLVTNISAARACQREGLKMIRTHDHRFLVSELFEQRDITSILSYNLGVGPERISDQFFVDNQLIIVRTNTTIGLISIKDPNHPDSYHSLAELFALFSDIDLVSFEWGHGFVRTRDGSLCSFGKLKHYNPVGDAYDCFSSSVLPVIFPDAGSINEIVCGPSYSLFLMQDGRVYAQGSGHIPSREPDADITFRQVSFPKDVLISKIVTTCNNIFYITSSGLCYYANTEKWTSSCSDQSLYPQLLNALANHFVEDAFALEECIAIRHDEGRLSLLPLKKRYRWGDFASVWRSLAKAYVCGTKQPQHMPFFDDKGIAVVIQLKYHTCFVTDAGQMYECVIGPNTDSLVVTEVPFFRYRPVSTLQRSENPIRPEYLELRLKCLH